VRSLLERSSLDELALAVMNIRGAIAIPEPYLGGHASTAAEARSLSAAVAAEFRNVRSTRPPSSLARGS
jgi:S-DNA-T family DNA segregation ATPase FtsK/SpoIIIE